MATLFTGLCQMLGPIVVLHLLVSQSSMGIWWSRGAALDFCAEALGFETGLHSLRIFLYAIPFPLPCQM
jgi:hypothetical protein